MNIFALDVDPRKAAEYHVNSHVVKMPVESRQMLSAALHSTLRSKDLLKLKKSINLWNVSHLNHPSTKWARSSLSNWRWLRELALDLLTEHEFRYGTVRSEMREGILALPEPPIPDTGLWDFSLAMPIAYQELSLSSVEKYRVFYANEKSHLFSWKKRQPPHWIPSSSLPHSTQLRRRFGSLNFTACANTQRLRAFEASAKNQKVTK